MFNCLVTQQILFGTFTKAVNEMQRIRYDSERLSYMDTVAETMGVDDSGLFDMDPPQDFSDFNSSGEWGGITMTVAMAKAAHNNYMLAKEQ